MRLSGNTFQFQVAELAYCEAADYCRDPMLVVVGQPSTRIPEWGRLTKLGKDSLLLSLNHRITVPTLLSNSILPSILKPLAHYVVALPSY